MATVKQGENRDMSVEKTVGLLLSATARLRRAVHRDVLEQTGLDRPSFETLRRLEALPGGEARVMELAGYVSFPASTFSRLVDSLEEQDLVKRVPDPQHRRAVLVQITAHGRQRLDVATKFFDSAIHRRLTGFFDEQELGEIEHMANVLMKALRAADPGQ